MHGAKKHKIKSEVNDCKIKKILFVMQYWHSKFCVTYYLSVNTEF